ncbi:hypothetical protein EL22_27665 [Halostagnicola sp. A56]|uniref:DUF7345 domain-containing protein n=1 Tax=Halostagnicola sp. A56 TaxID=1495067 RepID=UPI00065F6A62|nr:hypothetical protein [Halostagnicola sp. A56]KMT45796.1 hypothetical protein EL22_27665 [Halostagnicola sp. A56]
MRLSPALTLALVALLTASTLGTVAAAPTVDSPTGTTSDGPQYDISTISQDSDVSIDTADPKQTFRLNITESGDSEWTVEHRFVLAGDDEADQFDEFAAEYISDNTYPIDAFKRSSADVEDSVDRNMSIENDHWNEPRFESPTEAELETIESDDDIEVDDATIVILTSIN